MNEASQPWLPVALKYGAILGVLTGLATIGAQMLQGNPLEPSTSGAIIGMVIVFAMFLISLGFNYKAVVDFRDDLNGGWVNLGKAFLIGLVMYFVADMVAAVFNYIYLSFFLPDDVREAIQDAVVQMEEQMADAPAFLQKFTTRALESSLNPISAFVGPFIWIIWNAIKALIMAAVTKKDKPVVV